MSKLKTLEKQILENLFQMGGGYVLNFTDRTSAEFFRDNLNVDFYAKEYDYGSGSKANRMRGFWLKASTNGDVAVVCDLISIRRLDLVRGDAMSASMKHERYSARPHGFRATFRTWVEETTDTLFDVKESTLGLKVDTDVVRAYQRSDRLEKRRDLLQTWSSFLQGLDNGVLD